MQLRATLQGHTVSIDRLRVFFRSDSASAPQGRVPLVLVHGLALSGAALAPLAQALAADFPVYVPDLPGFGKSQHPAKPQTLAQMADWLSQWMDRLGLEQANLLGNSLGGQIVIHAVLQRKNFAGKLILDGPDMDPSQRGFARRMILGFADRLHEPVSLIPRLTLDTLAAGPLHLRQAWNAALKEDIEKDLPQVKAATLVVRAQYDGYVSQAWAERLAGELPCAKVQVIPGDAHYGNFESPQALAECVRGFLL